MKIIDLTQTVTNESPTWPGSCGFSNKVIRDYEPDNVRVTAFECFSGIGTHMDLPSHFVQGGDDAHEFDINKCIAPLYVLHAPHEKLNDSLIVGIEHFEPLYKRYGDKLKNSFIAVNTGWHRKWNDSEAYRNVTNGTMHFPTLSVELAQTFIDLGCVGLGIDTLSPDSPTSGFPIHHMVLPKGMFIIENMTNLNAVPDSGAKLCATPLKLTGLTESPVRAIAIIDSYAD